MMSFWNSQLKRMRRETTSLNSGFSFTRSPKGTKLLVMDGRTSLNELTVVIVGNNSSIESHCRLQDDSIIV